MERPFGAYKGDQPYVFVSYDHDDAEVVFPEITRLRDQGFNIWYDEGIAPGATWRDEVAQALSSCGLVLFFVTPRSVNSSNCLKEINYALSRDLRILAVHLQPTTLPPGLELSLSDMQAVIRPNFSAAAYEATLAQGMRSLLVSTRPETRNTATQPPEPVHQGEPDPNSIAVLPFVNRSADPENEYLCDGISEALITGLAEVTSLHVASQLSSFTLKGKEADIKTVASVLSVAAVLSGSVQRSGNRLRVSASLDEVKSGSTLWAHRYDMEMADIFEIQDDVARQVIQALKVKLDADHVGPLVDVGTTNAEAYDAYLLGNYEFQKWSQSGFKRAITLYQQATQHDYDHADAFGRQGLCYMMLVDAFGVPTDEVIADARRAFHRARALGFDPRATMGWNGQRFNWHDIEHFLSDPDHHSLFGKHRIREMLTEAISLIQDPTDPRGEGDPDRGYDRACVVLVLLQLHRSNLEFLRERRSLGKAVDYEIGNSLFALGQFEEAADHFTSALKREPDHHFSRHFRALAYVRTGQLSKASADLAMLDRVWPKSFDRVGERQNAWPWPFVCSCLESGSRVLGHTSRESAGSKP